MWLDANCLAALCLLNDDVYIALQCAGMCKPHKGTGVSPSLKSIAQFR